MRSLLLCWIVVPLLGLSKGYKSICWLCLQSPIHILLISPALLTASASAFSFSNSAPSVGLFSAKNNDAVNFLGRCQRPSAQVLTVLPIYHEEKIILSFFIHNCIIQKIHTPIYTDKLPGGDLAVT